jgi:hypothetical protein
MVGQAAPRVKRLDSEERDGVAPWIEAAAVRRLPRQGQRTWPPVLRSSTCGPVDAVAELERHAKVDPGLGAGQLELKAATSGFTA